MAHSPMYHRLMMFVKAAERNLQLEQYDDLHSQVITGLDEASESYRHYRANQGFEGETGTAIDGWLEQGDKRLDSRRDAYLHGAQMYTEMRRVMMHAREEAERLSPVLVDKGLDSLRDVAEVTIPVMKHYGISGKVVSAVVSTGAAVYDAIAAQANAQREANAADILQRLNASMQGLADQGRVLTEQQRGIESVDTPPRIPPVSSGPSNPSVIEQLRRGNMWVSAHEGGVYPGDRDSDFGRSSLRGPNSGLYPGGFDDPDAEGARMRDAYKLQSRRIPYRLDAEGEPGTRTNPITDPQDLMGVDLMHTRIGGDRHANGTIGGYTPAPPTDRDHPLWRINGGPATDASTAGRLGGAGMLGAGALGLRGAARAFSGGTVGPAPALHAGSFSGRGFGTYTPPAASASQGGAGGSGHPGYMGGTGAGVGGTNDDKKQERRKYEPYRYLDDDEGALPEGYVNPMSQTYGSDRDITPAKRVDDGWDPRQW